MSDHETRVAAKQIDDRKRRCADCDEDCWHVQNKLRCWMGWADTDHCPWVHGDVPFPPKPTDI